MKDSQSFKNALQISAFYLIFGMIWIYSSDTLIELFSNDAHEISLFQTYKGFFFIVVTSVVLYFLSYRIMHERSLEYTRRLNEQKTAQNQLARQDALLRTIVNSSPDAIFVKDLQGKYLLFNNGAGEIVGMSPEKVIGSTDALIFSPETASKIRELDRSIISGAKVLTNEEYLTTSGGIEKTFLVTKGPLFNEDGKIIGIFGISRDITEQKISQIRLEKQNALFTSLINSTPDAIVIKGLDRRYIVFNEGASKFSGLKSSDALGKTADEIFPPKTAEIINAIDDDLLENKSFIEHEETLIMPDGKMYIYWVTKGLLKTENGEIFGIFGIYRDITTERHHEQIMTNEKDRFDFMAHHDSLTGLPNRLSLMEDLEIKCSQNSPFAFLFLDLDGFKEVNDSYGHRFGDKLLIRIAEVLQTITPSNSKIIRTGGDEFVVILECNEEENQIDLMMQNLLLTLRHPFNIDNVDVYITASVGIAMYPSDADNSEDLFQKADAAMYNAKKRGRNTYSFYESKFTETSIQRTTLSTNLKKAIQSGELSLYYQPQVDQVTEEIIGLEALCRWFTPEGAVSPGVFIPIAEESGLILEIGEFVLREGCLKTSKWDKAGLLNGRVAINISARQLSHVDFIDTLDRIVSETQCDPKLIELEITESSILNDPEYVIALLHTLKERGFFISIDDFGTGYSSLSYLKNLPIDKLKIDQSFIRNITDNRKNQTIVKTIIALAKGLEIKVLAEGVETTEELEFLRINQIDSIQGYYFYKPMDSQSAETLFRENQPIVK